MAAGRPSSYTDETDEQAREYLSGGYKGDLIDSNSPELGYTGEPYPTIAGLALYLGISRETVYAWKGDETKPEFSDIVDDLMATQEMKLIRGGILNEFNPTITKLALTKHNYSDRQDMTVGVTEITQEQWLDSLD